MPNTLKIGSTSPLAILITEPNPTPDKPGDAPELRTLTIRGAGTGTEGVTEGVDADLYHAWLKANPHHPAVENGLFREIGDNDPVGSDPALFGFEPGLKAVAGDAGPKNVPAAPQAPSADTSTGKINPPAAPKVS